MHTLITYIHMSGFRPSHHFLLFDLVHMKSVDLSHKFNMAHFISVYGLNVQTLDNLGSSSSCSKDSNSERAPSAHLLNCGKAWAISLTFRGPASEEILRSCLSFNGDDMNENLLYRSVISCPISSYYYLLLLFFHLLTYHVFLLSEKCSLLVSFM